MDFEVNQSKIVAEDPSYTNLLAASGKNSAATGGGDVDHSPENVLKKSSESTEDFEHVNPDEESLLNFAANKTQAKVNETEEKIDNLMDDFMGSMKTQYGGIKTDLDKEFSQFGKSIKDTGSNILSGIESNLNDRINQTKDFLGAERGNVEIPSPSSSVSSSSVPSAPPSSTMMTTSNEITIGSSAVPVQKPLDKKPEQKFDDFLMDNEPPYSSSPINKLIKEDNEKFISSEDLLGDFKDERTRTPEPIKEKQATKGETIKSFIPEHIKDTNREKFISSEDLLSDFKNDHQIGGVGVAAGTAPVIKPPVTQPSPLTKSQDISSKSPKESSQVDLIKEKSTPQKPLDTKITPSTTKATPSPTGSASKPMISAEEIFYRYGLDAWFKPDRLHPIVESLIYWRDVKKSGIVFGTGLVVLLAISCFSVISVFAYLSLTVLSGTIAFRIYKTVLGAIQKTSEGHPFKEYLELDLTLSQEKVQQIVNVTVAHLNGFISEFRRLFLVEDLVDSLKFGVILLVLTYIGAWFNGMTLVILAFVALFTLPKVYENNKQSIDTYLDLVRSKFLEITDKVKAAVPIGKKPETDKDK